MLDRNEAILNQASYTGDNKSQADKYKFCLNCRLMNRNKIVLPAIGVDELNYLLEFAFNRIRTWVSALIHFFISTIIN